MTTMRSTFAPEQDVLRGLTPEQARREASRLAVQAANLTDHLARVFYPETSAIRQSLEDERNSLESAAADLESRLAEATGEIQPAGPVPPILYCRNCGARNQAGTETVPTCRLCGTTIRLDQQRRTR